MTEIVFFTAGIAAAFMFAAHTGWRPIRYSSRLIDAIARKVMERRS